MKKKILRLYCSLLGFFAKKYVKKYKPFIIGVNGSVGKTSCRMIIKQTIEKFVSNKRSYTSSKNFNGELGLPLSIFQIEKFNPNIFSFIKNLLVVIYKTFFTPKKYDIIVLEYGIDYPGEMDFLLSIMKPNIGVFTAVDSVHSEQFGDPGAIARDEMKMIQNTLEVGFLNYDDSYTAQVINDLDIDTFTYQTVGHGVDADIYFDNEKIYQIDNKILVRFDLSLRGKKVTMQTNILGKANYGYIGVALMIADILSRKYNQKIAIEADHYNIPYTLQAGRLNIFEGIHDSVVIDSTYNASPLSIRKIINTAQGIKEKLLHDHKVWLVLGDMRELGDLTEKEHRLLAGYVSQVADRLFLVGDSMTSFLADELEKFGYGMDNVYKFTRSTDAGFEVKKMLTQSEHKHIIVFKGSQNTIFLEEGVKHVLSQPSDEQFLVRQSKYWIRKKKEYID